MTANDDDTRRDIYALWDALADCHPTTPDTTLNLLLSSLCKLVEAQNANWFGAVRMPDIVPGDPVHGWRPRFIHYLHPVNLALDKAKEQVRLLEAGIVDVTTVRNVAMAGSFRCNRLSDLADADWFESEYYRVYYLAAGHLDTIWAGVPISDDAEVYIGLFRDLTSRPFTVPERETVASVLRGLKWFLRQSMLVRGLLAASAPLSGIERKVLHGLLGGETEKQIAAALNQSPHTTHTHVMSIYRKFGVKNRAKLSALWLGKSI